MPEQYMEQYVSRRQSAPRLEFEAAAIYEYPEHLRPWLEALPKQPGVYFFHGDSDTMPLYIGKSVNIRSRVMSHLRTPDEASMLRQSRRITWIETAGELGALLLEAGSSRNSSRCLTNACAATASCVPCRLTQENRRLFMPGKWIFRMNPIFTVCLPTNVPHCKPCNPWLMNYSFVTAC